jgi:hypothetical protein
VPSVGHTREPTAGFPVPVHLTEPHRLQPFSSELLSFPDGATGELWPFGGESTKPRELWPLLAAPSRVASAPNRPQFGAVYPW